MAARRSERADLPTLCTAVAALDPGTEQQAQSRRDFWHMPIKHRVPKHKVLQRPSEARRILPKVVLSNPLLWVAVVFVAVGVAKVVLLLRNPNPGGMSRRYRLRTKTAEQRLRTNSQTHSD